MLEIQEGDLLISATDKHSCNVKFVESHGSGGTLLVDGTGDEWFEPHEYSLLTEKYVVLCKKEDRQDLAHFIMNGADKQGKHVDVVFKELVEHILKNGVEKGDRTGTGTISTFGNQIEVDLADGFPLLTTKRVYWKGIAVETVAFLKGITDLKFFLDHNVDIWTRDAYKFYLKNKQYVDNYFYGEKDMTLDEFRDYAKEHGFDMGVIYGSQWIDFNGSGTNQLNDINDQIKNNPDSRRMKVYSANPSQTENQTLPPCHDAFQFYVHDNKLSCIFQMRSSDTFHGLSFNIGSYAFITHIFAKMNGLEVGKLIAQLGDSHIYKTHLDVIKEQITREPLPLPSIKLSDRVKNFKTVSEIELEDVELVGYKSHGKLTAPQAF